MAFYYIHNNQIAGVTDDSESAIADFRVVEGADLPISLLYWDGASIQVKPDRPSEQHYWSDRNQWELPEAEIAPIRASWEGLLKSLKQSGSWDKAYNAAERTIKASAAFNNLSLSLAYVKDLEDLKVAIAKMREAMRGINAIGDWTTEELADIRDRMTENGFDAETVLNAE